ncbi:hypothetical protein SAMN05216241_10316 [Limimonas halophila]|uniref:Uncharacterized protein n=1 Tax=Limimonas halophila TaxID=1082479 RepID=A0A1G7PPS3_9PROT|nr:hypothetical protein [Limimonas halophila]SDF88211.1 hypothetical protein SAMN05216241_10316 [Limimonas halophila]
MTLFHRTLTVAVLAAALAASAPAAAQDEEPQDPGAQAREGAEQILDALRGLLQMMPRYGMPQVQEDGDIVIPRLDEPENGDGEDAAPDDPDAGVTETRI